MLSVATGVVQAALAVVHRGRLGVFSRAMSSRLVARAAVEVVVAFVELLLKVEVVLFELADALVECVDVDGGTEPGLAPGMFAERLGKPFLQLVDAGVEAGGSFVGGQQVRPAAMHV